MPSFSLTSLLFQQKCCLCHMHSTTSLFCPDCSADLLQSMLINTKRCKRCACALVLNVCPDCTAYPPQFKNTLAVLDYASPVDYLIGQFKQQKRLILAKAFAQLMVKRLALAQIHIPKNSIFVPIPSSSTALKRRGFNPANEFAKALASLLCCKVDNGILLRHQLTASKNHSQKELNQEDRRAQASQLYFCKKAYKKDLVYLIDDVLTTGSTVDGATRALKAAGVQTVKALVIARTPVST